MYKFRFENAAVASIWFQRLKEASTFKQNNGRPSENLIALDWSWSNQNNSISFVLAIYFQLRMDQRFIIINH